MYQNQADVIFGLRGRDNYWLRVEAPELSIGDVGTCEPDCALSREIAMLQWLTDKARGSAGKHKMVQLSHEMVVQTRAQTE